MEIKLPNPKLINIEPVLIKRRSIREYKDEPLTLEELSQLLFACQGITDDYGFRTAPSAGATYPLEIYVSVKNVVGLSKGVYKYIPHSHSLLKVFDGDIGEELATLALNQYFIAEAPVVIIFTAVYERATQRYGKRGIRYVHMEVGYASQNVYLEATALNLGTVAVGAFDDEGIMELMGLEEEYPLLLMPVGRI
ncbi:SagB/ThcOx family dehydrogenase [Methanotorris igneus]|uniref:SagB-type dehydrogenase domain protein n=1 Tax=Methanotorris igneus (strain DSM 5666 / JCM 11834 / Kol 5) TaxID=880724 RepID=F6BC89_METIK|nr:SagB/ThcOx family dehydrogenase [Methanotorris igneus]AEF97295.1 SagB-type dehydrogenase domain protein [Methanotorris igneus Kol 5]